MAIHQHRRKRGGSRPNRPHHRHHRKNRFVENGHKHPIQSPGTSCRNAPAKKRIVNALKESLVQDPRRPGNNHVVIDIPQAEPRETFISIDSAFEPIERGVLTGISWTCICLIGLLVVSLIVGVVFTYRSRTVQPPIRSTKHKLAAVSNGSKAKLGADKQAKVGKKKVAKVAETLSYMALLKKHSLAVGAVASAVVLSALGYFGFKKYAAPPPPPIKPDGMLQSISESTGVSKNAVKWGGLGVVFAALGALAYCCQEKLQTWFKTAYEWMFGPKEESEDEANVGDGNAVARKQKVSPTCPSQGKAKVITLDFDKLLDKAAQIVQDPAKQEDLLRQLEAQAAHAQSAAGKTRHRRLAEAENRF